VDTKSLTPAEIERAAGFFPVFSLEPLERGVEPVA
jgi:hypothetical protein